jgi:hypothetical protein
MRRIAGGMDGEELTQFVVWVQRQGGQVFRWLPLIGGVAYGLPEGKAGARALSAGAWDENDVRVYALAQGHDGGEQTAWNLVAVEAPSLWDRVRGRGVEIAIVDSGIWAQEFGHTIVPPRSATVALGTEEEWPSRVEGVTLRGVEVVVRAAEKVVARYKEDVLFTRFGLSGPAILNVSQQAMETQEQYPDSVIVGVRTDPDLRTEDWEARLQMALRENPRQLLKSLVARWWPVSLAEVLLEVHDIPPEVMANQVTKMHRHQTAELLDEFRLHLKPAHPMATAKVTTGGVDLRDIDPCSMQSLVVSGLFIAGQLLDIDGVSDGYDLQGAYSTGYLAGRAAATREPEE